jgi:hypothetical protein
LQLENNSKKIKLDGPVHDAARSDYVVEEVELAKRKPRILIALLAVIAVLAFIWGGISQFKLQSIKEEISKTQHLQELVTENGKEVAKAAYVQDSLENFIYKLQTENDLLAENFEPPYGVFFEVQIGTFSDFNLDQYNKNLANLRQEKYNEQSKFLLGRFRSFKQALLFESDLKRMGINSAFIVGRIDDRIVTYKEAIEAQEQRNN